jgi:hypothetical protein
MGKDKSKLNKEKLDPEIFFDWQTNKALLHA